MNHPVKRSTATGLHCAGVSKLTPMKRRNRPGQPELKARVGTHAAFLETMLARLAEIKVDAEGRIQLVDQLDSLSQVTPQDLLQPLLGLTSRDPDDPSVAFMDAWATVADVLSFYQERIINEGYLRTARERLSLHELSKLVGYRLKPGLSASTHLAFTVEDEPGEILIPKGTGVQTIPKQKELPQTFETMEDLKAKHAWNMINPRKSFPLEIDTNNAKEISYAYVGGTQSGLKENDFVVFEIKSDTYNSSNFVHRRIKSVEVDAAKKRTRLEFQIFENTVASIRDRLNEGVRGLRASTSTSPEAQGSPASLLLEIDTALNSGIGLAKLEPLLIRKAYDLTNLFDDDSAEHINDFIAGLQGRTDQKIAWKRLRLNPKGIGESITKLTDLWKQPETIELDSVVQILNASTFKDLTSQSELKDELVNTFTKQWDEAATWFSVEIDGQVLPAILNNPLVVGSEPILSSIRKKLLVRQLIDRLSVIQLLEFAIGPINAIEGDDSKVDVFIAYYLLAKLELDLQYFMNVVRHVGTNDARFKRLFDDHLSQEVNRAKDWVQQSKSGARDKLGSIKRLVVDRLVRLARKNWLLIGNLTFASAIVDFPDRHPALQVPSDNWLFDAYRREVDGQSNISNQTKTRYAGLVEERFGLTARFGWSQAIKSTSSTADLVDAFSKSCASLDVRLPMRMPDSTTTSILYNDLLGELRLNIGVDYGSLKSHAKQKINFEIEKLAKKLASIISQPVLEEGLSDLVESSTEPTAAVLKISFDKFSEIIKEIVQDKKDEYSRLYPLIENEINKQLYEFFHSRFKDGILKNYFTIESALDTGPHEVKSRKDSTGVLFFDSGLVDFVAAILNGEANKQLGFFSNLSRFDDDNGAVQYVWKDCRSHQEYFQKLWASWFGKSGRAKPYPPEGFGGFAASKYALDALVEELGKFPSSRAALQIMQQLIVLRNDLDSDFGVQTFSGSDERRQSAALGGLVLAETQIRAAQDREDVGDEDANDTELKTKLLAQFTGSQEVADQLDDVEPWVASFKLHAFKKRAKLFGANANRRPKKFENNGLEFVDWDIPQDRNSRTTLFLDGEFDEAVPQSLVLVNLQTDRQPQVHQIESVKLNSRHGLGVSGPCTELFVPTPWRIETPTEALEFHASLRKVEVFVGSFELELLNWQLKESIGGADKPIEKDFVLSGFIRKKLVGQIDEPILEPANTIELEGVFPGLYPGKIMTVSGNRAGASGVISAETLEIKYVWHIWRKIGGETPKTRIQFTRDLKYSYDRESTVIYANVAPATHGDSQSEVLGNGKSGRRFQAFQPSKPLLAQLPAFSEDGFEPELEVRVNEVQWKKDETLNRLQANDEKYLVEFDPRQNAKVKFGDGRNGSRLPAGTGNVRANYRVGLGRVGNVERERISQIKSPPLGVQKAINPVPASGGIDPESVSQGRKNVPVKGTSLSRIVSVRDYEFFTRNLAGIAKAYATTRSLGKVEFTHITIAATDDAPIDYDSMMFRNLVQTISNAGGGEYWGRGVLADAPDLNDLQHSGSRTIGFHVSLRRLKLIDLEARIHIRKEVMAKPVMDQVRQRILSKFSFENAAFGKTVFRSDVIETIQQVANVNKVDLASFGAIEETSVPRLISLPTPGVLDNNIKSYLSEELKTIRVSVGKDDPKLGEPFLRKVEQDWRDYFAKARYINGRREDEPDNKVDGDKSKVIEVQALFPAELVYLSAEVPETLRLEVVQ